MTEKTSNPEAVVETAASDTIEAHPSVSRSELLAKMVDAAGAMQTPQLMDFCSQALAFAQNPNYSAPTEGDEAKNKGSIATKPSDASPAQTPLAAIQTVREDLDTVLAGQELPAEAVEKLMTLFEAAVNARVGIEVARIQDEHEQALNEDTEELIEQIDQYLDYAAKEFFEENQVAIENSLKIDLYEEFLDGLRDLFAKHWVDIPEDRVDVAAELADRVEDLEQQLNDKVQECMDLEESLLAVAAKRVFESASAGLTDTDREKLRTLTETVEFDGDEDKLSERIKVIREAHFSPKEEKKTEAKPGVLSEGEVVTVEVKTENAPSNVNPEMAPYVAAVSRMARRA